MTYKEAISALRKDYYHVDTQGAVDFAIEVLEKADKYRWHDLRKNPNDLPQHHDFVFVCIDDCGGKNYTVTGYGSGSWDIMSRIIAWREIELFEEEE